MGHAVPACGQQAADQVEVGAAQAQVSSARGQSAGEEVPEHRLAGGVGLLLEGVEDRSATRK